MNDIYIPELHECFGSMAGEVGHRNRWEDGAWSGVVKGPTSQCSQLKVSFWSCVLSQKRHSRESLRQTRGSWAKRELIMTSENA